MGKLARRLGAIGKIKEANRRAQLDAWHGTPHEVDKFSSSNIGTGEGAQQYGHGLYFGEGT